MQLSIDKLGKVAVTVEESHWSNTKDYDKLTIVEAPGNEYKTYISRKPVPAGTVLTNRKYWIPFSSLREEIVLDYNTFVNLWTENLAETNRTLNQRITDEVDTLDTRITNEVNTLNERTDTEVETLNTRISRERHEVDATTHNLQQQINANDEDIVELYKAIASVVAGGVALAQRFGDREDFGISQKVLTESRDDLQAQIDAIVSDKASVALTVTPGVVFADGTDKTITFIATSTPTKATIIFDGGEAVETTRAEFPVVVNSATPTTVTKSAEFTVAGLSKGTKSATVSLVHPIYTGAGASDSVLNTNTMIAHGSAITSPSFTKSITTQAGDYLYFEIPSNMSNITKIQLYDDPTFPTELSFVSINTGRSGYKAFKTVNQRGAGTHTYKIS